MRSESYFRSLGGLTGRENACGISHTRESADSHAFSKPWSPAIKDVVSNRFA